MPVGQWLEGFGIAVASRRAPRQPRVWGAKRAKLQKMKKRGWELADIARHVIECRLTHTTRVRSALDDVASNVRQALSAATWRRRRPSTAASNP